MHVLFAVLISVMSPEQRDVWAREQLYWDLRSAGKVEEFMALWDDEFTGWPFFDAKPVTKTAIRAHVEKEVAGAKAELEPLSVRIHGEYAFVFYRAHVGKEILRMHHTWHRTAGVWKIIEGMSARE